LRRDIEEKSFLFDSFLLPSFLVAAQRPLSPEPKAEDFWDLDFRLGINVSGDPIHLGNPNHI
jgi:hypothetical protein